MMKAPLVLLLLTSILLLAGCAKKPPVPSDPREAARSEQFYREQAAANPQDAGAQVDLAEVLAHAGNFDEAMQHFTTAESLGGSRQSLEARRRVAVEYGRRAEAVFNSGDVEGAKKLLDQARVLDPQTDQNPYMLGRIAEVEQRPDEALSYFREAYNRNPNRAEYEAAYADALVARAREAVDEGRYDAAVEYLNQARPMLGDAEVSYLMGSVNYAWAEQSVDPIEQRELLYQAVESFRRVLRANPGDQDARYNLAAVLLELEEYEEAAELYKQLSVENPRDGELYQALSMVHGRLNMSDLALAENAAGRALRADEPVEDVTSWARRSAQRFSGSDLSHTYNQFLEPEEILTYKSTGGKLDEVWFYWTRGMVFAFREGGLIGEPVYIEGP